MAEPAGVQARVPRDPDRRLHEDGLVDVRGVRQVADDPPEVRDEAGDHEPGEGHQDERGRAAGGVHAGHQGALSQPDAGDRRAGRTPGYHGPDARPRPRAQLRHPGRPCRRRAGRADGRRLATDLPDRDLCAGRRRPAAWRLRVLALAEPDPGAARTGGGRPRGRRRTGSSSRRAPRRPRRSPSWPARARRSWSATTSMAGRTAISSGSRRGAGVDARYVDLAAGPDVLWEALTERTRLVWFETPSNPHLKVVDIAAIAATVAPARGGGRPAAPGRGRQHVRLAGHPAAPADSARTSSSTRPPSTCPVTRTRSWAWR